MKKKLTALVLFAAMLLQLVPAYSVFAASTNLALGKPVTSSSAFTNLSRINDGDKSTSNYSDGYPNTGVQWVQVDLGASYNVNDIKLWHYFGDSRKYRDVVVQLSNDATFATNVTTVFNNDTNNSSGLGRGYSSEYSETSLGKDIKISDINARYVRVYSNGSSANNWNHYVEIEVYGTGSIQSVPATSIKLDRTTDTLAIGGANTLTATVLPSNASNKDVTWSSSAPNVAAVSSSGVVTGISEGTATITAKSADGNYTASCVVTVSAIHPTSVSLNKTTGTLAVGGTDTLTATVFPANAANKNVTWSTSAPSVAKVSISGVLTGLTEGTAIITATTVDGSYTASCSVTVSEVNPTSVSLNKTTSSLTAGGTDTLTATVLPSNAANKNVIWSTSAPAVAAVSTSGIVTGLAAGTAVITAKTVVGNYTASCTVTVAANQSGSTGSPALYGAVGDGVTNDTIAIQKAINSYAVVDLQGKTYLTNQLNLKSNITIKNGTLISKNAESILDGYKTSNVVIDNISIDGQNSSENGIFLWLADNATVSNCTIKNMKTKSSIATGIQLRSCYNDKISNCKISNIVGVQNGTVGDEMGASRGIYLDNCTNTTIDLCDISEIRSIEDGDGIHFLGQDSSSTDAKNVVSNCKFVNCDKRFIKLQQSGATIYNNELLSNNSTEMGDAMISVYASNIALDSNKLNGNTDVPIAVGSEIVTVISNISIKNNNVTYQQSNWQGSIVLESSSLIEDVIIDGNTIVGYKPIQDNGVLIRTYAKDVQITNNTMSNVEYGVYFKKISGVNYVAGTSVMQNITVSNNNCTAKYGLHYEEQPSIITGLSVK